MSQYNNFYRCPFQIQEIQRKNISIYLEMDQDNYSIVWMINFTHMFTLLINFTLSAFVCHALEGLDSRRWIQEWLWLVRLHPWCWRAFCMHLWSCHWLLHTSSSGTLTLLVILPFCRFLQCTTHIPSFAPSNSLKYISEELDSSFRTDLKSQFPREAFLDLMPMWTLQAAAMLHRPSCSHH